MASLRRYPNSRFWIACFTDASGRQIQRSTKETDKKRAMAIAQRFAEAARTARLGFLSEQQARKVIGDIYAISNRQPFPNETVRAFFARWIESKRSETQPKTYTRYAGIVSGFIQWLGPLADIGLQHLKSAEIVRYRDCLAGKQSASSVNVALACLQAAFSRAFRDGLVDTNEVARVDRLADRPAERQQRRAFTDPELRAILAVCDPEWRGMVLCGAYTGARLGDVASLQWANVDLDAQELHFSTEKTGRSMSIPIAPPLYRHLMEIAGTDNPAGGVFPRAFDLRQRDMPTSTLSNQFYKILTEAGLVAPRSHRSTGKGRDVARATGGLGFHCLRHTATTLLKRAGASNVVAMEIIGHDTAAISRAYSHIDTATLRAAVDKLPDITSNLKGEDL
jgi:integrase